MPSAVIGFISGGVQLVSGNPYSGLPYQPRGITLKPSQTSGPQFSGAIYVGFSGGLTITSGGSLSSGGQLDGFELVPGNQIDWPVMGGPVNIWAITPAASSGGRLFWYPNW